MKKAPAAVKKRTGRRRRRERGGAQLGGASGGAIVESRLPGARVRGMGPPLGRLGSLCSGSRRGDLPPEVFCPSAILTDFLMQVGGYACEGLFAAA